VDAKTPAGDGDRKVEPRIQNGAQKPPQKGLTMSTLASLTETETALLAECELEISENLRSFRTLGKALATVRDGRLYRAHFATFEDYCEQKWGISRSHGNGLADAFRVVDALPADLSAVVDNERQARELAKVPESQRADVLNIVVKSGEKLTAAKIQQAAKAMTSTSSAPSEPKKISPDRFETIVARETEKFLTLLDEFPDHDEPIEEALRFLFETVEERYLARHPEHASTLADALRKLLAQLEKSGVAA
jgi:hypothetical protein